MSGNQSKSDRTNNDYKRSGRPNNPNSPRNYSGGGGRGGGGGGSAVPPSSGYYSAKSYKKVVSNNAASQGVQTSRVAGSGVSANANVNTGGGRGAAAPNGAPVQPPLKGTPDTSAIGATVKPTDTSVPKSTPGLPKAPPSSTVPPSSGTGNATGPATPVKGSGDASKSFSLQFGSISPGFINGIQLPARTSSAPPNMDEQQRAQARLDSLKPTSYPNPPVPKQQLPRKDIGPVDQPNTIEVRPTSKEKNDILSTPPPVTSHTQKPAGPPMSSIPMQMQFRQPPLPIPFGAPNSPLQSQGMPNPALPVPFQMLSVGNPQHFVPGIPPHQGLIHPSQALTFPPHMGPQIGNMGIGMGFGQQFQQQQQQQQQQPMGNFSGGRRTVKITHPDTHEELRLDKRNDGFGNDGSAGPRPHPHGLSQAHQMNLYSNSYNTNPHFLPTQTAPGSQAPRLYNQTSKQVTVKPAVSTHGEKVGDSSPAVVKSEIPKSQRAGGEVTSTHPHKDLETVNSEADVAKKVTVSKEEQKQPAKKAQSISTDKVDGQASSVPTSSVPVHESVDSGLQETHQSSTLSMESNKDVLETSNKLVPSSVADVSASECDNKEGLSSSEAISLGTNLDNTPEDEGRVAEIVGSEEQVKESVVQNQDSTVADVTVGQQKENVNYVDDKSSGSIFNADLDVLSTQTSSLNLDDGLSKNEGKDVDQVNNIEPVTLVEESHDVSVMVPETAPLTLEADATSGKVKANTGKVKKKKKDILKNADARGTTSDLYNAYKRPEEKKETLSAEIVESDTSVKSLEKDVMSNERHGPSKVEPEDWEDAADISAPKMGTGLKREDDNDGMTKKYSRDFLLKFLDQCTDLPEGFEITSDIAEALIASSINMAPHPSPARGGVGGDRSARNRHPGNLSVDDKWNKGSVPIMGGQGWVPMGYPGRGNQGVLQTPRGQPPNQYAGGFFPGQMPSPGPQGHPMQRNNSGSDRWQRATGYQQGFMPSPHTPVMHKAERKYQVGNITDEEQAKQRQLKGILNKLTPQNFEKLFEQVKQVNIDNANTLSGVIGQIFDKALMEPTFVEMYANFCSRLAVELPDFSEDDEKITFKRLLLNKCQEEFERGEREQEEANRTEEEGEVKQTEEEREEKRVKARRRMLGNIRLIGELYKKKMLTERIMHECIKKLLGEYENPDEEDIEALCKLMSTIGEMIDHPKAKEHIDAYFSRMLRLSDNMVLSSRVRFMLKDSIDLRKNKWQQRRKVEGPKKIEEVHRDAAQERQAQSSRLARGPTSNPSLRRGQPMDFGPKGSNVLPFNPQMSGYRGVPQQQARSFGNQDPRAEERHFANRTLVPLRPMGDENPTFGPQGGLARGMLGRGQPPMQGTPLHGGPNGYGSMAERTASYGYVPERISPRAAYDPSSIQHQNMNTRNTGRVFDRLGPFSPPEQASVSTPPQSGSSDEILSEDRLHDKSVETIKEFYSARDEKEVALCIKDLNAPRFYPTMISIWVTDSFERKDKDRDSLANLLINLTRSQDGILSQDSLVRGFESVLSSLEDAVNDAPKAGEYLGQLFAKVLLENVIPYKEVWRLIYEGGEEPGGLVKTGHAADVLGVILEIIKSEKGDPFLKDLYADSNLRLENFRSPTNKKTSRLDKFF